MPTLIPKSKLIPDFINEPSVMDPLYKRAIRSVVNATGIADPTSGLPMLNPMSVIGTGSKLEQSLIQRAIQKGILERENTTARTAFNTAIDDATKFSRTRFQRKLGTARVNNAYDTLVNRELAAPQSELNKLKLAPSTSSLKPKPTGLDIASHQTAIHNALAKSGYQVTPEDTQTISNGLQTLAATGSKYPRGTGDYVRGLKSSLHSTNPLAKALAQLPGGWGAAPRK